MPYTEIKQRNGNNYFYRVVSVRNGSKVSKKRKYLGDNLSKGELIKRGEAADKELLKIKIDKTIKRIKPKIIKVLRKYEVKKAGIFGSYARGKQTKKSDIDIIINPPQGIGIKFVRISLDLEHALKKKVDLITYKYISPYLKKRILKEEVRII